MTNVTTMTAIAIPPFKNNETLYFFERRIMTFTISNGTRSIVIQQYLQGKSRDDISRDCGLGAGTVSNIIAGWKANLDQYVVEDLRELGINLKKSAISPAQCARGSKIISTLEKLGVNEDNFENFISSIYLYCRRIDDLAPHKITSYLEDLIAFSKTVPFSQIKPYIEEKKKENTELEQYKQRLESQIQTLEKEEANSRSRRDAALCDEKTTNENIQSFIDLKAKLRIYGLDFLTDIPKFVQVVNSVKELGFDVNKVLSPYQDSVHLDIRHKILTSQINEMSNAKLRLEQNISALRNMESLRAQRMYVYDELEAMGLGLNELRLLRNTIGEIAAENDISSTMAVQEFFKSLEKQYDIKLRSQFQNIQQQYNNKPHDNNNDSSFYPEVNSLPLQQQQQQQQPQTPPVVIPNIIFFSHSLTGLTEKKTLEIPDKLKEANELEFACNDKYYASESGNNPTTATFGYPLPQGIHEFSTIREYRNTERYYTKTSRSIAGERNDQLGDDYNGY
jgi:hypothetical protein